MTGRGKALRFGFDCSDNGPGGWYFIEGQKVPAGVDIVAKTQPLTRPVPPVDDSAPDTELAPKPEPRKELVLQHDYGRRGKLIVNRIEEQIDLGRQLSYVFLLQPIDGSGPVELFTDRIVDDKPIGGGDGDRALIDAQVLDDLTLVEVSEIRWEDHTVTYCLGIHPPEALKIHLPTDSSSWPFGPAGHQPERKVEVSGSLVKGIALNLVGPKDTFRFRFSAAGDRAGWHEADEFTKNSREKPPWQRLGPTTRPATTGGKRTGAAQESRGATTRPHAQ